MSLNEEKRIAFEALLDKGKVHVIFDFTVPGVIVPTTAQRVDPQHMVLIFSHKVCGPDFKRTDEYVTASLRFGGVAFKVTVPWAAVRALTQNGQLMESWMERGLPQIENPVHTEPKTEPPAPVETVEPSLKDFGLADDPEMAKWFGGTVAEG